MLLPLPDPLLGYIQLIYLTIFITSTMLLQSIILKFINISYLMYETDSPLKLQEHKKLKGNTTYKYI